MTSELVGHAVQLAPLKEEVMSFCVNDEEVGAVCCHTGAKEAQVQFKLDIDISARPAGARLVY